MSKQIEIFSPDDPVIKDIIETSRIETRISILKKVREEKRPGTISGYNLPEILESMDRYSKLIPVESQRELLTNFFKWLNEIDGLGYTEKGIDFYVNDYLKDQ